MDNKTKLSKIDQHQNNDNRHRLTCGYNSHHLPLVGKEEKGEIILVCSECAYKQKYIPEIVFN